jgi:glycosyltransferase involved in cell wall biosynthesis
MLVERTMAGRAVIATREGGPTEIIEDGRTSILVSPSDPASLRSAMRDLIERPKLRYRIVAKRLSHAMKYFESSTACHNAMSAIGQVGKNSLST